jgi:transcription initiation factor TFIIIB Brf1 subunit/transcription initiation factor TFIIB
MEDIASIVLEERKINSKILSDVFTAYQNLIEDLKLPDTKNFGMAEDINYVATRIGLSERASRLAFQIYKEVREKDRIYFSGKASKITATSLLYIACAMLKESDNFDELGFGNESIIKEVAGISSYILKKRVLEHLAHPFFKKYKEQVPIFMLQEILTIG